MFFPTSTATTVAAMAGAPLKDLAGWPTLMIN
jgi:hypothetical protein